MADKFYQCEQTTLAGTNLKELTKKARRLFREVEQRTKRQPYLRSAYFKGDKIFIKTLWAHLAEKSQRDKSRRLRFYACALELIVKNKFPPLGVPYSTKKEKLYRFLGRSAQAELFIVQIREDLRTGNKYFTSVFPYDKQ